MSNIIGLDGKDVPDNQSANPDVVQFLEELLERARSGHLHGIVSVADSASGVSWSVVGSGMGFDMIGDLEMAKAHLVKHMEA